jgi:aminodeoxyfutalosine deaminase
MSKTITSGDVQDMPKVELHVHLGGTITEETARDLAGRHGLNPTEALRLVDDQYPGTYRDFSDFLDTFLASNSLVRTPDDLYLVAQRFARNQARENVVWSEVIFTAMIYVRNGMDPRAMWRALTAGLSEGGEGVRIGIVVDVIRDLGREEAEATIRLVEAADAPIVGLCLTGIENTVPTIDFTVMRDASNVLDLGLEVHAGEMGPPSSITDSLDILHADRIGHGVAADRDQALLARLIREQVPLDVCPTSNVAILAEYPSIEDHPVARFWDAGVNFTVSSDDPPFFGTTVTQELMKVAHVASLSQDDLLELQRRAVRNSFASEDTKTWSLGKIRSWEQESP